MAHVHKRLARLDATLFHQNGKLRKKRKGTILEERRGFLHSILFFFIKFLVSEISLLLSFSIRRDL